VSESKRVYAILVGFGLLASIVAGCGDTPESAAPSDAPEQAEPEAPNADEAPEENGDEAPEAPSDDTVPGSFEELLARYGDSLSRPGQVVYEWEAAGVGAGAQMTIAQDPPRMAYRVDTAEGSFHTITGTDDGDVVCFAAGGVWQCMPADAGMADMLGGDPFEDVYDLEDVGGPGFDPATVTFSADTIAGRSAICMAVPESDGVTDLVMCLDEETGMMLWTSGNTPDGPFSMEAVSFSAPDPAMFTPPGEIMDFPGMPVG
jgi:hypothetical protein